MICNVVSGVSGKDCRASAGATATSHPANNASICVRKLEVGSGVKKRVEKVLPPPPLIELIPPTGVDPVASAIKS